MSALQQAAKEVKKDYEKKLETYINAACMMELIGDTELYKECIRKAAGAKMMLAHGGFDKFINKV